jgi:hypothetical protein
MYTWFEECHAKRDQRAHILKDYDEPVKYGDTLLLRTACGRTFPAGDGTGYREVDLKLADEKRLCQKCQASSGRAGAIRWPIKWSSVER